VMTAATKSRIECSASDKIPKLPVSAAKKTFNVTSTTADPIDPSAAKRFSREACSWSAGTGTDDMRWIIRSVETCSENSAGTLLPTGANCLAAEAPLTE
jgi:hypothetical protein